jgi:hypothetical protein
VISTSGQVIVPLSRPIDKYFSSMGAVGDEEFGSTISVFFFSFLFKTSMKNKTTLLLTI